MSVSARRAGIPAALAIALAACQPATGSLTPAVSTPAPAASSAAPSSESSPSVEASSPPLAGQTDTDWGRIWDSLPAGFPNYPGSAPAEEAATGPASAVLAVQGVEAKTIADWMQSKLEQATYSTEALSGTARGRQLRPRFDRVSAWLPGPGVDRATRRTDDGDRALRRRVARAVSESGA